MNALATLLLRRLGRLSLLLALVLLGTLSLVRYAPGYFSDSREMDAEYAGSVRAALEAQRTRDSSASAMARSMVVALLHGELGKSRQYDVAVSVLIRPRLKLTAKLLGESLALGWLSALAAALPFSARQSRAARSGVAIGSAILLAVPIGALATIFLMKNTGGPVLAMALLLAARDFKFLYRLLQRQWQAPHLFFARAQGIKPLRLVFAHLLPPMLPQLASLLTMSVVAALSLDVPAEVLFDVPGVGQLAWNAATNRDLPLLVAITLLMALAVGCASLWSEPVHSAGLAAEMT